MSDPVVPILHFLVSHYSRIALEPVVELIHTHAVVWGSQQGFSDLALVGRPYRSGLLFASLLPKFRAWGMWMSCTVPVRRLNIQVLVHLMKTQHLIWWWSRIVEVS